MANDVYQIVTDRIVSQLEQGVIPWRMPWSGGFNGAVSYTTGRPYSFLNQMLLGDSGEYLTFNQVKALGGNVKKGAKSRLVVFYKPLVLKTKDISGDPDSSSDGKADGKQRIIPMLRYYHVFHLKDTDGIASKLTQKEERHLDPIAEADMVADEYVRRNAPLKLIITSSDKAFYSPANDSVTVPELGQYGIREEFYSTLFHELTHSTMTKERCDRKQPEGFSFFGSHEYSKEELVAEMGAAMSLKRLGIDCDKAFRNSVGYIQSWLKQLRNDKKFVVWAAGKAEQAVRYMFNDKEQE